MKINLNYVSEKDMDLLIIEEFISSKSFASLFLDELGIDNYELIEISHSINDADYGETDIRFIISVNDLRYAILIEDKINAIAMPEQCLRYFKRGDKLVKNEIVVDYFVFIVAPNKYLQENLEAKKYPFRLSYETILEYFNKVDDLRSTYKYSIVSSAIDKGVNKETKNPNYSVTKFHKSYKALCQRDFYNLNIYTNEGIKGSNSTWFNFKTTVKGTRITHKTENGYVDLMLANFGDRLNKINIELQDILKEDMLVVKTAKSASIRLYVSYVDCHKDFDKQELEVIEAFDAVKRLQIVSNSIEFRKFIEINKVD